MASVLLVTLLVAVVLAGLRTAASMSEPKEEWIAFAGIAGLFLGSLVGAAIGSAQPDPVRQAVLGTILGMVSGAIGGIMVAMPRCLPVVVLGALMLVGFAALISRLSRSATQDHESPEASEAE